MLQNLITLTENWRFLLIEDNLASSGRQLLVCFLQELLSREHEVHFLFYDYFLEKVKQIFPNSPNLHSHDGNNSAWIKETAERLNPETNLEDYFDGVEFKGHEIVIALDSLTTLLLFQTPQHLSRSLIGIKNKVEKSGKTLKILALLHEEPHDSLVIQMMEDIASTIIHHETNPNDENTSLVRLVHRRPNNKVLIEEEIFKIIDHKVVDVKKVTYSKAAVKSSAQDPTIGLSFKLTLDEREQEARRQLILPYTRSGRAAYGGGDIVYEADANDDFDEEDPDDDLNI